MKKNVLIIAFLILYVYIKAQNPSFQWAKDIKLTGNDIINKSIALDSTGNVYITGSFLGTIEFNQGPLSYTLNSLGPVGVYHDIFIAKFDNTGNFLWAKQMGGVQDDFGNSINIDKSGNVYTIGYFENTADFDPGTGNYFLTSNGDKDVFISKLDSSGNFLWARNIGDTLTDLGNCIKTDRFGNVYVAGTFQGTVDFNAGAGNFSLTSGLNLAGTPANDIFISKYDSFGNFIWAINQGGGSTVSNNTISDMELDNLGNIYTTGSFNNGADFDPSINTFTLTHIGPDGNAYFCKLSNTGSLIWVKNIDCESNSIAVDSQFNVYATGRFTGFIFFGSANSLTSSPGYYNNFVLKLDPLGNALWAKMLGNAISAGNGMSVATDLLGNVYTTGYFAGTPDFDPGPGSYQFAAGAGYDAYISKLTTSGNFVTAYAIGGVSGGGVGHDILLNKLGDIYTMGNFVNYTVDIEPGVATNIFGTTTMTGGFLIKMGYCNGYSPSVINTTPYNSNYCPNNSHTMSVACNNGVNWYSSPTSTAVIATGLNFTTPILSSGIHTFYAEVNTCTLSLAREAISILVAPSPTIMASDSTLCIGQTATLTAIGASSYTWNTSSNSNSITISPTSSTSYSLSAFDAATGCFSTANKLIIVNQLPIVTASITAGDSVICSETNVILQGSGALNYLWSGGISNGVAFQPNSTNSYTVIGTDINACSNSAIKTITVNPTPVISAPNGTVCPNQAFTITPTGAVTYSYSSLNPVVYTPSTNTYTVTGVNSVGCSAVTTLTVYTLPLPNVTSNSNAIICLGNSFTISASGAVTYTYASATSTVTSTNNTCVVTPTTTTQYTVFGASSAGCVNYKDFSVTVDQYPTLVTSQSQSVICTGTSDTLSASGAFDYFWSNYTFGTSIIVSPTVTTNYFVTGATHIGFCLTTDTFKVVVNPNCQAVWPGDANSDGTADILDVLELGLHYTQTGAPRVSTSNTWQSYFATNWAGTITNGKNLNHSDCNGDGTINDDDTLAIYNNYALGHTFKLAQTTTVNPQLTIVPDQAAVVKGNWGTASIYLGDDTTNINNINGVAFTIGFYNTLIEPNSIWIEYPVSFINAANQNLHFRKLDFANGEIFTATTHTINNNVSGNGLIAKLHYQIKSTLTTDEVLNIGFLNIGLSQPYKSDVSGVLTPLTSGSSTLMAIGASVGLQELNGNSISISPNPTNGSLIINSKTELQKIEVVAITGQVLLSETPTNVLHSMNLDNFANGIYFINLYQNDKVVKREKVILNK